jgi:alkylation response protein AidB-like acyl-CoA dehydrogenase
MDFALSDEQRMLVDMVRRFVEEELYPHEAEVERLDAVPPELQREIRAKAMELGIYAANMPEELGGGGLDNVSLVLLERELGRAAYALSRPAAARSARTTSCPRSPARRSTASP